MKIPLLLLGGNSFDLAWCDLHVGDHLSGPHSEMGDGRGIADCTCATDKWQEVDATMKK